MIGYNTKIKIGNCEYKIEIALELADGVNFKVERIIELYVMQDCKGLSVPYLANYLIEQYKDQLIKEIEHVQKSFIDN